MKTLITFMLDSASRPELLECTMASLKKHVKVKDTEVLWVLHEAFVYPEKSESIVKWAKESKLFDMIQTIDPPKGEGWSISNVLSQVETPYFVHWEDDYEAIRNIDLDFAMKLMKEHSSINQIIWNRRDTMPDVSGWKKKEMEFGGVKMVTSPHWRFSPAFWRMAFILPRWKRGGGSSAHWEFNHRLRDGVPRDANWVAANIGTFYLGKIDEKAYCQHIGKGKSGRTPWENGK